MRKTFEMKENNIIFAHKFYKQCSYEDSCDLLKN